MVSRGKERRGYAVPATEVTYLMYAGTADRLERGKCYD
jgi:hypothetical protein